MNKDITVLFDDKDYVTLTYEKNNANKYIIMGLNDCFNYEKIAESNSNIIKINKKIFNSFLNIKVFYIIRNQNDMKDIVLGSTKPFKINKNLYEKISINSIKSYNGITLSFSSNKIYDKYYLYEKKDNNYVFIMESDDFQITSKDFKEGSLYYVEGYNINENILTLKGKSDNYICKTKTPQKDENIISIIVPIYNSEKFLSRCIDSILLSTFTNFEIILIDDGSTDNSPKIADWYANKYSNLIQVIHKKNEGVSFSRNKGIELASGKYTAFVDNDDLVHPLMYEKLYLNAITNNLDIAICKTIIRESKDKYSLCLDINKNLIYDYDKMMKEKWKNSFDNIFFVAVWNKIIKTSLLKDHPFPLNNYYEDSFFTRTIYSYIDKFGFSSEAYYVWDKRIQNTVGTSTNNYKSASDNLYLHKNYKDALFYCVKNGDKSKIDYLIYDSIKEVYDFLNSIDAINKYDDVCQVYNDEIIKLNNDYNILENKYLNTDSTLFNYVENILISK